MTCERARELIEGEPLQANDHELVDAYIHCDECAACAQLRDELTVYSALVAEIDAIAPPPDLEEKLLLAVRKARPSKTKRILSGLAVGFGFVAILSTSGLFYQQQQKDLARQKEIAHRAAVIQSQIEHDKALDSVDPMSGIPAVAFTSYARN